MFVYTLKATTLKYISVMAACIVAVVATVALVPTSPEVMQGEVQTVARPADYKKIKTKEDRVKFLESYGWEVDLNSETFLKVRVPYDFDSVYEEYNALQISQGLNLEKYKGKEVDCYSYKIINYDGEPYAVANLMIYKNKIIGGDISSSVTSGFIHGFEDFR